MANRILIVADDPLVRAGLGAILAGQAGVTVAGQTGSADLAAALRAFLPDVVVWDLGWEPERRCRGSEHLCRQQCDAGDRAAGDAGCGGRSARSRRPRAVAAARWTARRSPRRPVRWRRG
ncbi:MAG: hypothetical protein V9G19_10980 [Tetrasphaera sp.]